MTSQRQLSITADMTIDICDKRAFVRGDGSTVTVEVPSVAIAFQIFRALRSSGAVNKRMNQLPNFLSSVGLTVVVRTAGRKRLTIGREANSRLLRLFGFRNAKLHLM